MDDLYSHRCGVCGGFHNELEQEVSFSKEVLARMLREIYDGLNVRDEIQRDAFMETLRLFNEATVKGLEESGYVVGDRLFYEQLRTNNEVFSAFRTHRMQNDLAARMIDDGGKLKPFDKWVRDVEDITDHYVMRWLRTEYDTAVLRAHQAADWKRFEADSDVLPNLRWMPTTSPDPDIYHRQYWEAKLTLPVGHPFWKSHRPGDRWNCKCSLEATDEPATAGAVADFKPVPQQPGLDNNPADDGKLFSDSHPYIANAHPGAEKAVMRLIHQDVSERIKRYPEDKWEMSYISSDNHGFVVTQKERIKEAQIGKPELQKFEKEMRMCKVIADNGYKVEYLRGVNRPKGQTYDVTVDSIKADLKCITGGAGNIVKYAKKALTKQGGEAVIFELPDADAKYFEALDEARRKCIGKILFYVKNEKKLKEVK